MSDERRDESAPPEQESEDQLSKGKLVLGAALILFAVLGVFESRAYLKHYFTPTVTIEESQLLDPGNHEALKDKRIEVALHGLRDSGVREIIFRGWGDSSVRREVGETTAIELLRVGAKDLIVNRKSAGRGETVRGAMSKASRELKSDIRRTLQSDDFDRDYHPFYLDETAYDSTSAYWGVGFAFLGAAFGIYLIVSEIREVSRLRALQREGAKMLEDVLKS